jgi:hypothetical protein
VVESAPAPSAGIVMERLVGIGFTTTLSSAICAAAGGASASLLLVDELLLRGDGADASPPLARGLDLLSRGDASPPFARGLD